MADWFVPYGAMQHLKNPLWKLHAKFRNAQVILMGFLQGVLAIGVLFAMPLGWQTILLAALISLLYWDALMLAPIFPNADRVDPEFDAETPRSLGLHPQQLIGYVLLFLLLVSVMIAALAHRDQDMMQIHAAAASRHSSTS